MRRYVYMSRSIFGKTEVQVFLKDLSFNFFKVMDVGQRHKSSATIKSLVCSEACIVRTTAQLCLSEGTSYPPLVDVFTTSLSLTRCSLLSAKDLSSYQSPTYQLRSGIPSLESTFLFFPALQSRASPFTVYMSAFSSSGGRKNFSRSSPTGFVDTLQSKESGEEFQISSLSMKEFLRRALEADNFSSQPTVAS